MPLLPNVETQPQDPEIRRHLQDHALTLPPPTPAHIVGRLVGNSTAALQGARVQVLTDAQLQLVFASTPFTPSCPITHWVQHGDRDSQSHEIYPVPPSLSCRLSFYLMLFLSLILS